MARQLTVSPHHSKGAPSSSCRSSRLRPPLEPPTDLFQVRSYGCSRATESQTSQDQLVMHLLSCLAAYFSFYATHVPGVQNTAADTLLRNRLLFTFLAPQGQQVFMPSATLVLLVTTGQTEVLKP